MIRKYIKPTKKLNTNAIKIINEIYYTYRIYIEYILNL